MKPTTKYIMPTATEELAEAKTENARLMGWLWYIWRRGFNKGTWESKAAENAVNGKPAPPRGKDPPNARSDRQETK